MSVNATQTDQAVLTRGLAGPPSPQRPGKANKEDAGAGADRFSYALAAASLRAQAAHALEAHGATPAETSTATRAQPNDGAVRNADPKNSDIRTAEPVAPNRTADARGSRPVGGDAHVGASSGTVQSRIASSIPQIAPPVSAASAAPIATSITNSTRTIVEAGTMREGAVQRPTSPATRGALPASHRAASEPDLAAEKYADFARLIARRAADGASEFELRLDPPHLGRITGKLSISEEGRTVISLSFDNPDAFDIFSRDTELLRGTLADAGLSVGSEDLNFLLTKREPENLASVWAAQTGAETSVGGQAFPTYEPQFFASWSSGSIDIRI